MEIIANMICSDNSCNDFSIIIDNTDVNNNNNNNNINSTFKLTCGGEYS